MTRLRPQHRIPLLAILLLCLSWSMWLQGNHVHIAEHTAIDACVVCHYGAAALPAIPNSLAIVLAFTALGALLPIASAELLVNLRPPTRAPPLRPLV